MKYLCIAFTLIISTSVFAQIQQNVNKTTGPASNPISDIDSIRFNGSQTEMEIILNNGNIESHTISDINNVTFTGQLVGEVTSLDCAGANINGALIEGVAASGVSAVVSYIGGNGGPYNGQTVNSTGVTGLTATLAAGSFANGSGTLTYAITGTPSGTGTGSFALNIGGTNCVLTVTVSVNVGLISTLNCAVSQTFTNNTVTAIPDLNCLTSSILVSGYSDPINTNQIVVSFTTTHASMSNLRLFIQAPNGSLIGLANLNNPNGGGAGTGCAAASATLTNVRFGDAGVDLTGCPANNTLYLPNYSQVTIGCNYTSTGYTGVSPTANGNTQTFAGTLGATYNPNGTWNLIIIDATATNTGSLTSWSIILPDYSGGTINRSLVDGFAASGVSANVVYTGGNGGPHNGQTVTSTGITGLTATVAAGSFANGNGTLTYTITGTPACSGTASFALNIGGQSCTLNLIVNGNPAPTFYCLGVQTPVVEVTSPTGRIWMDRNLGASRVATGITDSAAYGDLYQWGRGSDGHQCRNSPVTTTLSCSDQPTHGDFIIASNPPDWRNPQNTNLWQGVNGINNPCPNGFRIPTQAEFDQERQSWATQNAAGAFNSPLKLPMGGGRRSVDGTFQAVDFNGYYWTSTIDVNFGNAPRYLGFFSGGSGMDLSQQAYGLSVRCIKD